MARSWTENPVIGGTIMSCMVIIVTIIIIDRGPGSQQEADDVFAAKMEAEAGGPAPIDMPSPYHIQRQRERESMGRMANKLAEAYAQGRADQEREGCRRKIVLSNPIN